MTTCSAIGCRVTTKMMFCGSHYKLLPKFEKDKLKQAGYTGKACIEAIEHIAERERKEITLVEYTRLENRYGKS